MADDMNDKLLKKDIENLKKNPVFNMSLSGKELFHSNMLAMFLQHKIEEKPSSMAKKLKALFSPKLAETENIDDYCVFDVLREKKNRDLIIIYTTNDNLQFLENYEIISIDDLLDETFRDRDNWKFNAADTTKLRDILDNFKYVVIENKFKSFPYIEQLEEYTEKEVQLFETLPIYNKDGSLRNKREKIKNQLKQDNTKFYLLAPERTIKLFFGENDNNKYEKIMPNTKVVWYGVPYDGDYGYLSKLKLDEDLKNISQEEKDNINFLNTFIKLYCEYVNTIIGICIDIICNGIKENGKFFLSKKQSIALKNGRIHDVGQKILSNILLERLKTELPITKYKDVFKSIGTGYEHQSGFIDFRFNGKKSIRYGIQIQESGFSIFIVAEYKHKDEKGKSTSSSDEKNNNEYFTQEENLREIRKWIETQANEIQKRYFEKEVDSHLKFNKDNTLKGYEDQNKTYCSKYGIFDLNDFSETKDYRDITYEKMKKLIKISLDVLSEAEPFKLIND